MDEQVMQSIMADLKQGRPWDYIAQKYGFECDAQARRAFRE